MKNKRLKIANGLQKSINSKRGNLKDAAEFIAAMEGKKDIIIKAGAGGYDQAYFRFPVHLAKDVLGVMHTLLVQDLKAAEEVFKRL